MRLAIFNRSFWPDVEATGQLLTELCTDLCARHDITVVAGRSYHVDAGTLARPVATQWLDAGGGRRVRILRVGNTTFGKASLVGRLVNLATYFAGACLAGFRLPRPEVIVAETDPPVLGLLGLFFKHWHGCRFVYYCQDIHPDVGLATGRLTQPLLVGLLRWANRVIRRGADRIVVVGSDMKERLAAQGAPAGRIDVCPNWTDSRAFADDGAADAFRREHGLAGAFVVMYSGNLGLSQGLESVLAAAEQLRDRPEVQFVLVGDGASRARLQELARTRNLTNVRFLPYQPKARLGATLGAADVHIIPLQQGVAGCLAPSKVYGVMAAGRPFVASMDAHGEVARLARTYQCGRVTPPGDPDRLADEVRWCQAHPDELARMGANGRGALLGHFDRPIAVRRLEAAVTRVLDSPRAGAGADRAPGRPANGGTH